MMQIKTAGIFAAGLGARFAEKFPNIPKPMIPVLDKPLIEWTVKLYIKNGIENITILLNSKGKEAKEHLKKSFPDQKFIFIVKDTVSSYESFRLVSQSLALTADKFILSTVDSFYTPEVLTGLANTAQKFDAVLSVTDDIKDEKPLWADIGKDNKIIAMGDWAKDKKYATGGLYLLTKNLTEQMPPSGQYSALRHYLADTVLSGKKIFSFYTSKNVDVDTPEDIAKAEQFIKDNF